MRTLSLIIVGVVFSFPLQSQVISDYGVKVAMTVSDFDIVNKHPVNVGGQSLYLDYTTGSSLNPSIGLFARLPIIENVILETELLYLQKGARKTYVYKVTTIENPEGTGETINYTNQIGLHYLQFSANLLPKIKFENIDVYGIVGPTLGYLTQVTNFFIEESKKKDFAFGYSVGIGVNLREIISNSFLLEVKYCKDFSEFYSSGNGDYWNRVFILSLGTTL